MKTKTVAGIEYTLPEVFLLQDTGIGTSEMAARTCYNSFDKSENHDIKEYKAFMDGDYGETSPLFSKNRRELMNGIEHSNLLDDLAWTYFHHSILEHAVLTYAIKGTSRAVLQEHARHRIQAISVQSTRYTMSPIINAFLSCVAREDKERFTGILKDLDFLVVKGWAEDIEIHHIWNKLFHQYSTLGREEFLKLSASKDMKESGVLDKDFPPKVIFDTLQSSKQKRNVGDAFKWIVTDNWKVDMVVSFNLRSLKNYFTLRDSGAAFWQIQELARKMKESTPKKYLDLIIKEK